MSKLSIIKIEKMLEDMDIQIRTEYGTNRSFYKIIYDLVAKWNSLSEEEQKTVYNILK